MREEVADVEVASEDDLGLLDGKPVDDSHSALVCFLAERRAKGEATHLLGHALRVAPWMGTENDGAALHRRFPRAAVARAARSLLAVGLGAAAGDCGSRLRGGG